MRARGATWCHFTALNKRLQALWLAIPAVHFARVDGEREVRCRVAHLAHHGRLLTARRGEAPDLLADLLDPAVRLDLSDRMFNPDVYEGYEGIMRWRADVNDVWESYQMEPEKFSGGDEVVVVVVTARERGRGRGSGVEVDRHVTFLCRLRSGRVSEIRSYDIAVARCETRA